MYDDNTKLSDDFHEVKIPRNRRASSPKCAYAREKTYGSRIVVDTIANFLFLHFETERNETILATRHKQP